MQDKSLAKVIGKNIAFRRRELGLTQMILAERLGIGQDALSRMEKGLISPKIARLRDVAEKLQCPVGYLFRTHDDTTDERAATIADILRTLPPDGQDALVELVANAAKVMRRE